MSKTTVFEQVMSAAHEWARRYKERPTWVELSRDLQRQAKAEKTASGQLIWEPRPDGRDLICGLEVRQATADELGVVVGRDGPVTPRERNEPRAAV